VKPVALAAKPLFRRVQARGQEKTQPERAKAGGFSIMPLINEAAEQIELQDAFLSRKALSEAMKIEKVMIRATNSTWRWRTDWL